ncbi:hypothetical protein ACWAT4_26435 [Bradyrhizobium manausense]
MACSLHQREIREVVVVHGDGTVSPLMEARFLDVVDGIVRGRRPDDVLREVRKLSPILDMIR